MQISRLLFTPKQIHQLVRTPLTITTTSQKVAMQLTKLPFQIRQKVHVRPNTTPKNIPTTKNKEWLNFKKITPSKISTANNKERHLIDLTKNNKAFNNIQQMLEDRQELNPMT
ncbi:hypothetical protein DID75_03255 [Candidatus Marinamargulisbacteria bacterium SCGC AG-410-N11]|nr:hypothetical protein DID75_03255 [Candidatus Marinamargulisbacteria bacterium SCGC AG-410-N11]